MTGWGKAGKAANTDRKLALIRKASTEASYKHGIGGRRKTQKAPKPVTLPKLKCLEDDK